VGTFNSHVFYKPQGWEYETPGQNSPRQCYWSSEWSTWTLSNASGNLYHSGGSETHPWDVTQWKDQSSSNVTVTTVGPNIPFTYNALTDTHTAMVITTGGSPTGYEGLYLRGSDHNGKRRYYLVGTSTNNKRIEWDNVGIVWNVLDDSSTLDSTSDNTTYPDDALGFSTVAITGVNSVDLMSGVTLAGGIPPFDTYAGIYMPVQGIYDVLGTHKLVYRRTDGLYLLAADDSTPGWFVTDTSYSQQAQSENSLAAFPWQVPWTSMGLTAQENNIASAGWNNLAVQPNTNITNNVIGNWHI
jgi:hypothetical protein